VELLQGPHPPIEPGARKPPAFAAVLGPLVLAIDIVARHRLPSLAILMILAPVGLWSLPMCAKRAADPERPMSDRFSRASASRYSTYWPETMFERDLT
jgi:hypothetical protein